MKDSVILEGKIYISAKRAAKIINYAQDYIGQLCRSGKLDCKMIGRSWFVTEESLLAHRENAIDNTQERVLKVIKNNDVAIKETIKTAVEDKLKDLSSYDEKNVVTPVSTPIASPVAVESPLLSPIQNTGLKYESEKTSFLPELRKKVPATFELPKNILKLSSPPFVAPRVQPQIRIQPTASLAVSHPNPISTTMIIALLALGGFFFTLSVATLSNSRSLSYNEASVSSAASNLISEILKTLGLKRTPTPLASIERDKVKDDSGVETAGELNGIGVFPAVSKTEDELAKQKILNSFSDEVTIQRDQSGASGVITPVFRKTDGNEFVYVLVPVKEKKEE